MTNILELDDLVLSYGAAEAVRGVSLRVAEGEVVTLIGANGAGKSTTLKGIVGLERPNSGTVRFDGADVTGKRPDWLARKGLALVPEGRRVFAGLTVIENLDVASAASGIRGADLKNAIAEVLDIFPRLAERRDSYAWMLSGGEQQMLAMGRAIVSKPRLLLLDEPSLGLSPKLAIEVVQLISRYSRDHGLSVLLVEQNARLALASSDRGYVLETGRIVAEGPAATLGDEPEVRKAYLGS
ncbi:ABC transporter ATP-binding protein [Microbacterium sp. 1.5R]|uniref:ABC transporter ATP-binding protein n=1 Tax=Microbacterium sp. 1.5R TaxID=1916917 RepID=UPI0011A7856A|nr:ABC transporter ATP-binding protein [Microbacterium sp. 1.5R]